MEYSGFPALAADAAPVIRGSLESKEFVAFWQRKGRVVAGMSVNWPRSSQAKRTEDHQGTHLSPLGRRSRSAVPTRRCRFDQLMPES